MYHGFTDVRKTAHMFVCGEKSISFVDLKKDEYPPFDCFSLTKSDAIKLKEFLERCLDELKCEHESGDVIYTPGEDGNWVQWIGAHFRESGYKGEFYRKCHKCGEFYR